MEKNTIAKDAVICLIILFMADPCATFVSEIEFIPEVVAGIFDIPSPALRILLRIRMNQNDVDNVLNQSKKVNIPRINKPTGTTYLGPYMSKIRPPIDINTPLTNAAGKNNKPV